jgi:hypothetical protein
VILDLNASFPNGLLLLVLENSPEVPDIDGQANNWQNSSMVALAVLHEAEGEVALTVGDIEPPAEMTLLFEGILNSTRKEIEIWNVYAETLAKFKISSTRFSIKLWGDDPRQASKVFLQFFDANPKLAK